MLQAIDPALRALLVAENDGSKLPLALSRFAARFGVSNPTGAMNLATSALLERYWKTASRAQRTISVQKLCALADIDLVGKYPVRRRGRTVNPVLRRHDGLVNFSGDRPKIHIPPGVEGERACVTIAHEIGHVLLHRRDSGFDEVTIKLPTSPEEEALAEYAARLLLMPGTPPRASGGNVAAAALAWAEGASVTVHAATARIGDPDQPKLGLRGAILWRVDSTAPKNAHPWERLTPAWHLCPNAFIPIGKCHAKVATVVGELAGLGKPLSAEGEEDVRIGSLEGRFQVHAVAWGLLKHSTRLILSLFFEPG